MPKIVDRDAMQAEIIEAAFRVFSERGFHAAKMSDIARAAGLAKGTVYLYFKSKDALAVALIRARFAAIAQDGQAPAPQTLAAFIGAIRAGMQAAGADPGATRLLLELLGPGFPNDAVREEIGAFFQRLGEVYAGQIESLARAGAARGDIDSRVTGAVLVAALDGLVMHNALFDLTPEDFSARLDAVLLLIETALRP